MRPIDADAISYVQSESGCQDDYALHYDINELPTIDPIKAAGGCYCRECRNYVDAYGNGRMMCMRLIRAEDYSETGYMLPLEIETKEDDFCSFGVPREEQE